MFDNLKKLLATLGEQAAGSAPHLVGAINEAKGEVAKIASNVEQTAAAGEPVAGALIMDGARLGEGGLVAFLTAEATPYLGPAAAPLAQLFVDGGARAVADAIQKVSDQ